MRSFNELSQRKAQREKSEREEKYKMKIMGKKTKMKLRQHNAREGGEQGELREEGR